MDTYTNNPACINEHSQSSYRELGTVFCDFYMSVHTMLAILLMRKLKLGKVTQVVQIHTDEIF